MLQSCKCITELTRTRTTESKEHKCIYKAHLLLYRDISRLSGIISVTYGYHRLQLYRVVNSELVSDVFNIINEQSEISVKNDGKRYTYV